MDPSARASEVFSRYTFAEGTHFARPLSCSEATVRGIGREQVAAFHAARYAPAGSSLVAAGDVSVDRMVALAERFFGDWKGESIPVAVLPVRRRSERALVVVVDGAGEV